MAGMFDQLPPKLQALWRQNSAKGGRGAKGQVKARACKIGWTKSPDRFARRKEQTLARKHTKQPKPKPMGFFCSQCGKWHSYPDDLPKKVEHLCSCGAEHVITNGNAKYRP